MRNIFIKELIKKAELNKNIVLMVGDLGFNVVEPFKKKFPERFINAGVSEQNMASMAAGLAIKGFHVFIYSIANFPTFRCAEQIRNDIDYHNLPVTIVTVGSGVGYGNLGYTHHGIQDYGLMRLFKNISICSPIDIEELKGCMDFLVKKPHPSYLRLEKSDEITVTKKFKKKIPGSIHLVKKKNTSNVIISTGSVFKKVSKLMCEKKYKNFSHFTIPIWGQNYKKNVFKNIKKFKNIITVEDHLADGGFGSWLNECGFNKPNIKYKIKSIFINKSVIGKVGNKEFLEKKHYSKI